MLFWLGVAVALGVVVGRVTGGSVGALALWKPRGVGLVACALAAQLAMPALPGVARTPVLIVSLMTLSFWFAVNAHGQGRMSIGLGLLGGGAAMNGAAIAANGSMPVSRAALQAGGLSTRIALSSGYHAKHRLSGGTTRLLWLGDSIAIRPLHAVISAGDVAMLVGLAAIVALAMHAGDPGASARVSNSETARLLPR